MGIQAPIESNVAREVQIDFQIFLAKDSCNNF